MNKLFKKLVLTVLLLVISSVMIVAVSYAWVTLSTSPTVSEIQVGIGGGRSILLAPDIIKVVKDENDNDVAVHYPGAFDDHIVFSQYDSYDYLQDVTGLRPVSTADGISWILPSYDGTTGALEDISRFTADRTLANANASEPGIGNYIYLDFWIVSPGNDYYLRVSTDVNTGAGSFVAEHPKAAADENAVSGFSLNVPDDYTASVARVGFLTSEDTASTESMLEYSRSPRYEARYRSLGGVFNEPGEAISDPASYRFTVYEPNGTRHPWDPSEEGDYIITEPLALDQTTSAIYRKDISQILTVQENSTWKEINGEYQLNEILQTALMGKSGLTPSGAERELYARYLQGQVGGYINSGRFFRSTSTLYSIASGGIVDSARIAQYITMAGATDDVYITALERNKPQRIRMFIWLEGQDPDCRNVSSVPASDISVELELAGADG